MILWQEQAEAAANPSKHADSKTDNSDSDSGSSSGSDSEDGDSGPDQADAAGGADLMPGQTMGVKHKSPVRSEVLVFIRE